MSYSYTDFVEACRSGKIRRGSVDRVEPSSYEPVISGDVYVLNSCLDTLFRPHTRCPVLESLRVQGSDIEKHSAEEGFELKKGFTYLIPLREEVRISDEEYVTFSPKSSLGRLFLNTRLVADYNLGFDEIHGYEHEFLSLFVVVQPLAFNVTISEGLALGQIRFFDQLDSKVHPTEVVERHEEKPVLVDRHGENMDLTVSDDVYLHLDVTGFGENKVVGLRAKKNPFPLDISLEDEYDVYEYFTPMYSNGGVVDIVPGEYYLFASKECFRMPSEWNAEVHQHSSTGFAGPLHFAGFIDNGFEGNLVFEVRSDEVGVVSLYDGMPVSKVQFFETGKPVKLYGEEIGSHYDKQGLRVAKYFIQNDV